MSSPNFLEGKHALVTGASSGLGWQFALTLARAGAKVSLAARSVDKLEALAKEIEAFDGRALPVRMDVTDIKSIQDGVHAAETELGPIDILVNNSGVSALSPSEKISEEDFDFVMDTNAKGAFFVAQAVGRSMIKHGNGGKIINIASVASQRVLKQNIAYCMSKAAVKHMTHALADEWGRYNIQVNCINPGYIVTGINRDYWETDAGKKLISRLPGRRVGEPTHLDGTLLLLAGPGSDFMTGSIIEVDDGLTAHGF
ncbi:SDR family oxidoreductase [Sneathiella sp. P13V-1]|uniref:SDR family NAD(P)-dependent oxidoreductase n=1 Tax=Sneathiella sp. P13V-1 TaxID=2697366 RepID=UPI00187BA00D|nr:SDR family NAD(P)-dependent oxidoreductase [Sneathiella sp. P13V-1]MBE7637370.1 SDR family oxidoreductase [Sneathiella sp. P13V-1]